MDHDFDAQPIYRDAVGIAEFVYEMERSFPDEEIPVLFRRMREVAIQIGARLAEGYGREGLDDRGALPEGARREARGKLSELRHYVLTAQSRYFLDELQVGEFEQRYERLAAALSAGSGAR